MITTRGKSSWPALRVWVVLGKATKYTQTAKCKNSPKATTNPTPPSKTTPNNNKSTTLNSISSR